VSRRHAKCVRHGWWKIQR